jgi:DNA-binding NarL/FixJ family response regulator
VIVADNSLIVEAIRTGFSKSGEFNLVGHADARTTSPATIKRAEPDVVLLDDLDQSDRALELIRGIRETSDEVAVIVLSVQMEPRWLERAFDAGAAGAISKAIHPLALSTLVRETLAGHIFHSFRGAALSATAARPETVENLSLTDRELEILQEVAAGLSNGEVARRLWITQQTVKFHLGNIYRKLDVANRTEASHFAHVNGLVRLQREPTRSSLPLAS